jgi:hypothetical protein
MGCGAREGYQAQSNSECHDVEEPGSQTTSDKTRGQEGNSPDQQLRSQSTGSVGNDVALQRQPGCWLRSSHH